MNDFKRELVELVPKLLIYAKSLTKNLNDAEDLVQNSLIKALERESSFDGINLKAWVKTILRNTFLDSLRKKKEVQISEDMEEQTEKGEQEAVLLKRDIERCLEDLRELDREIVALKGRGFTYQEISEFVGKSKGNLRVILLRSKKQLAECLGIIKR